MNIPKSSIVTTIDTQDSDVKLQVKKLDDGLIWFRHYEPVRVAISELSVAQARDLISALQQAIDTVPGTIVESI
jgi:hypothetical protein